MVGRNDLIGMDAAMREIARQANAALPRVLTAFAEEALSEIRPRWPVKSGRSRAALGVLTEGERVNIVCAVPYARFIHTKGEQGPTFQTKIIWYIQSNADRIGSRVARRLRGVG